MKDKIYTDIFTASTLQKNGDICCPHCGSWTNIEDIEQDEFTMECTCPSCRKEPSKPTTAGGHTK
jgi:uncharacterized Zn finger protein (UPF0148 family)